MLQALDDNNQKILAWDADRKNTHYCPECREKLIFKHGQFKVAHFAHYSKTECSLSQGESLRHLEMKAFLGGKFARFGKVEYEVSTPDRERRADLVVSLKNIPPFVVECQVSPISASEWESRTAYYNCEWGYPILWVWDISRLGIKSTKCFSELAQGMEFRVPKEVTNYGEFDSVYVLDHANELHSVHIDLGYPRYNDYTCSYDVPTSIKTLYFKKIDHAKISIKDGLTWRTIVLDDMFWWEQRCQACKALAELPSLKLETKPDGRSNFNQWHLAHTWAAEKKFRMAKSGRKHP